MKIGLLIPLQGASGLWGPSSECSARLAASEVAAASGLIGEAIDFVVIDAGTGPQGIARDIDAAIRTQGIRALVGMHTSDLRRHVKARLPADMPYVYTPLYEGHETGANVFAIGKTPEPLLEPGIAWLAEQRGARRWFLIGNDYIWPHYVHGVARGLIARHGGRTVGEAYVPLGDTHFDAAIEAVKQARPDAVLMSVVGDSAVHLNRAFAESGLARHTLRLSTGVEENVLFGIGAENTENMFVSASYFANLRSSANDSFRERYHGAFGDAPPMQNEMGESCYEGVHFLAALANHSRSLSAATMRAHLPGMPRHRSARRTATGPGRIPVHLAQIDGFDPRVIASL